MLGGNDYCKNSSLVGVGHIVNGRRHISERIFWLICLILSSFGSYYLIKNYLDSFNRNAVSLVVENINPYHHKTKFPSIGICEMGHKKLFYKEAENIVNSLKENDKIPYNYEVEDFILDVTFLNNYKVYQLLRACEDFLNKKNIIKCPNSNYSQIAEKIVADCTKLFKSCKWNNVLFDCCKYFLPLRSQSGRCFLLNSIQTNANKSNFIDLIVDWKSGNGLLEIFLNRVAEFHILNEEDIPIEINGLLRIQLEPEMSANVKLNIQNIVNDPGVKAVPSKYRKCVFPDENPTESSYKYYSFNTCATDCLKRVQLKKCNCSHFNLITHENDKTPTCDFEGFRCLDNNGLIKPVNKYFQPWNIHGLGCQCLPSCNEHNLEVVQKRIRTTKFPKMLFSLQSLPTRQYRRQAVRGNLDVVVTVGGILGLFMGASIISVIELMYFFTYRLFSK